MKGYQTPSIGIVCLLLTGILCGLLSIEGRADEGSTMGDITFKKTFGGSDIDVGNSVRQTSDGGYIITGYAKSYGAGKKDIWLIKTDSEGNKEWDKTFGGSDEDEGWSVQQTSDGGYIITGYTESYGAGKKDVWLIKTDSEGNKEWDKTFGGSDMDQGRSVQQTSDGGYIITGFTESYGAGDSNGWLIKTDFEGNKEWDTLIGVRDSTDEVFSVQQTSDSGYIVTGYTYVTGEKNLYLVKIDSEGNDGPLHVFNIDTETCGTLVQQTSDGGYIVTGYIESDLWLIKTDSECDKEWDKTFGGSDEDYGRSVQQTSDGGYVITGFTESYGSGENDVWLIKTDSEGNKEWDKTFGGSDYDWGSSVQQTSDGGYVVTGSTSSYSSSNDVWLIKTDSEGKVEEKEENGEGLAMLVGAICLLIPIIVVIAVVLVVAKRRKEKRLKPQYQPYQTQYQYSSPQPQRQAPPRSRPPPPPPQQQPPKVTSQYQSTPTKPTQPRQPPPPPPSKVIWETFPPPPPPSSAPKNKYCAFCGAELPAQAIFCSECRKKQVGGRKSKDLK